MQTKESKSKEDEEKEKEWTNIVEKDMLSVLPKGRNDVKSDK